MKTITVDKSYYLDFKHFVSLLPENKTLVC